MTVRTIDNAAGEQMNELALFAGIDLVSDLIKYLQEHVPAFGYSIAFSGGKDSVVMYDIIKRSGVKHSPPVYSDTTIDPPELKAFIKEHYPEVEIRRPAKSFFQLFQQRGFPCRNKRWCCQELKESYKGNGHIILGIRAEESSMRANGPRTEVRGKRKLHHFYKPIFYWDTESIWSYIYDQGLPYCNLYDEGFHRLGCILCPYTFHGEKSRKLQLAMQRWPKYFNALEHNFKKRWERMPGRYSEIPWREAYRRYLNGENILNRPLPLFDK